MPYPILFVIHDFLPDTVAGTEVYTARVSTALSVEGPVEVFCTVRRPGLPAGTVLPADPADPVPVTRIVQNHRRLPAATQLEDSLLEALFRRTLDRFRPRTVHFQHLAVLPLSLPGIARHWGARVVFTLHDYFLACPSGGQLVAHPDGIPCVGPDPGRCAVCHAAYLPTARGLEARALQITRRWPRVGEQLFQVYAQFPTSMKAMLRRVDQLEHRITLGSSAKARPEAALDEGVGRRWQAVQRLWEEVDLFLAPSRHLGQRFLEWGLPSHRLEHFPNPGPDLTEHSALVPLPPSPPLRLLFLGTLAPHKGLDVVVNAMAGLPDAPLELTVAGDPAIDPLWIQSLRQRNDARVRFIGPVPPAEVPAILDRHHLLVMGSRWPENAPLTVLEAHARGRPVLASDIGGIPECVGPGRGGWLYPAGHSDALAHQLKELLEHPDRILAEQQAIRSPLTPATHADRLLERYRQLHAASPSEAS